MIVYRFHRSRLQWTAVYLALTLYFTWSVLASGPAPGIEDWDPLLFQHAAVMKNAVEYAQAPFWNPWYCGGNVLWQNPQAPLVSPVYLLALFLGVPRAMKIVIALHYLVGFIGMHLLLTRTFAVRAPEWRLFLAALFTLAGGAALHIAVGHATFLPYFYLPWLLWLFSAAIDRASWRHAWAAAAVLALFVWMGGIYLAVMAGAALAVFGGMAAIVRREWRPLALLAATGALTGLLAAPKLVPVLHYIGDPRIVDIRYFPPGPDRMHLQMVLTSLLEPFQYRRIVLSGQKYGWHEYGNYIGAFGAFLTLAALLTILSNRPLRREHWLRTSVAFTAVVLLVLSLGDYGAWSPYALIGRLPLLGDLRISARYLLAFTLFAAASIAAVVGPHELERGSAVRRLVAIALVIATLFLAYRNRLLLHGAFPLEPIPHSLAWLSRPGPPQVDAGTDGFSGNAPMLRAMMANRAILRCNEPFHLRGTLRSDRPIVFAEGPAQIFRVDFSPNRIDFAVTARGAGARVFMNQRYVRGWRSSAGPIQIDPASELPFVELPADAAGRYAFSFVPPGLVTGGVLWAAAMMAGLLLWRRQH